MTFDELEESAARELADDAGLVGSVNGVGQAALHSEPPTPEADQGGKASRQIARSATVVMAAFLISSAIGLLRNMVITGTFEMGALDSFYAANRITEFLFNLLAGGALGSAFIPSFTGLLTRGKTRDAWQLASGVFNVLSLILIGISALMWIFAPQVVRYGLYVLAPNSDSGEMQLTVTMLRIMLPTVVIFGVSGLIMGVLNAHQKFLIPALSLAIYNLGIIAGTLLLPQAWGVKRLAVGALLGAIGYLLVQVPAVARLPERLYTRASGWKDKAVREVLRLMVPRLIGSGAVQLNFVANTAIALSLGESATAAITLAFTLMLMPQAAVAQSAGIASLPTLSAQAEMGQYDAMRGTLSRVMRMILLLAIPSSVGLIMLRVPLVAGLLQRGAFDAESTRMVAWALLWYAVGLVGHSLVEVLTRAFFAQHDTKTPVIITTSAMALNIVLSFLLSGLFSRIGWMPHGGLALANSIATALECAVLWVIIARRLRGLEGGLISSGAGQALAGSAVMGLVLWAWLRFGPENTRLLSLLGGLVLGVGSYALVMLALGVPELTALAQGVARRFKRTA